MDVQNKYMYSYIQSSLINNGQYPKGRNSPNANQWITRQNNVAYPYKDILFNIEETKY
jgi:hypothetical protein